MTADLVARLAQFPDCVLTGLTEDGSPVSVRCRAVVGAAAARPGVVYLEGAAGIVLLPGAASLLCHNHDEQLWRLRSFLARGVLAPAGPGWLFTVCTVVTGPGMGGPAGDARMFWAARRRAGRYLARRGIRRPVIPWDVVQEDRT